MYFRNVIEAQIALKGLSKKQVSEYLGINRATFHRKLTGDSDFTMPEMKQLQDLLEFEKPWEVFFDPKLLISNSIDQSQHRAGERERR